MTTGILAQHTGKTDEQVKLDSDRDYYMSAQEAKEYGLVDEVVKSRKELPGGESGLLEGTAAAEKSGS